MSRSLLVLALLATLSACSGDKSTAGTATAPATPTQTDAVADPLAAVITGAWRDPANVARDPWRHPQQTLEFFGVKPEQTVIEVTPGGGWYAEILVPLLRERGHYIGVLIDPDSATSTGARNFYREQASKLEAKFAANPEVYDKGELRKFALREPVFGEPGSADVVLTFRNVHNWLTSGTADAMFQAFFAVLKPGGVLGIVEHRANGDVPAGDRSGYVGQQQVIAMATAAGFVLEAQSEINANPADTKNYEAGVWSLPPVLRLGDKDREKYLAIGESDRMTLRFRKPPANE